MAQIVHNTHAGPLALASFMYEKKQKLNQISVSVWSICRIFSSSEFLIVNFEPNWKIDKVPKKYLIELTFYAED